MLLVLVSVLVSLAVSQILPEAPMEWLELKVQASKFSDTNVIYIASSDLHGRGVMAAKRIKKPGKIPFLQFFEVSMLDSTPAAAVGSDSKQRHQQQEEEEEEMMHSPGYIPIGSDLELRGGITVREGIDACKENRECTGITFRSNSKDMDHRPVSGINFKSKGNVVDDELWHSYVKKSRSYTQVYFPLGCNPIYLSKAELSAVGDREAVACASRLLNHSCTPTCKMVQESVGDDLAVPGLPWTKGRVRSYYLHALRPLAEGEELSVDYNTIPFIMSPVEREMFVCGGSSEL
jgi:hypothetical protein